MTTWYSLDVDNTEAAKTKQRIMDAFMPKYVGSGRPLGMAIFSSHDQELNNTTLYFSPKAASLAIQFGASPHDGHFADIALALLVGDESSIDYLFPEADAK
ncbi:MAG: hypothetical protein Q9N32_01135 [Gammaproteobacteria bacterium]|nr:hypothetical protein [Gammaproteobacteria bacterium]